MDELTFAKWLLGVMDAGKLTELPLNDKVKPFLAKIMQEWLLFVERSPDEISDLGAIYQKLTNLERKVLRLIASTNRTGFDLMLREGWDAEIEEESLITVLKRLRKKLDKDWWFEISRSRREVLWLRRGTKSLG